MTSQQSDYLLTLDDVHYSLDCDGIDAKQIEEEHGIKVEKSKVEELVKEFGVTEKVAIDILQHYVGLDDDGTELSVQDAYREFYDHTAFHREGDH